MIRFACPSCSAVFTVADEKGGKKGKCPKCQSDFLIPEAESPVSPPPPPKPAPPSVESNDIEIKPCPGCQSKLVVEKSDLGMQVECPYCKTQYKAISVAATGSSSSLSKSTESKRPSSRNNDGDEVDRPKRKTDRFGEKIQDEDDDDEENERPAASSKRKSSRRSRREEYDDDDEEDIRPRRKSGRNSSHQSSRKSTVSRSTYIILAFLLGSWGVHNFVAGRHAYGAGQLSITVLSIPLMCVFFIGFITIWIPAIWAIVDMIIVDRDGDGRLFS